MTENLQKHNSNNNMPSEIPQSGEIYKNAFLSIVWRTYAQVRLNKISSLFGKLFSQLQLVNDRDGVCVVIFVVGWSFFASRVDNGRAKLSIRI